jgi:FMN phosphatase YigB (HAD superfamily)
MIEVVFFDIGGTLLERDPSSGAVRPFASSRGLLSAARDVLGLRVGVITNLGRDLTDEQGLALLRGAGLAEFLDPSGFVSDRAAGAAKPDAAIYRFAAGRLGVAPGRCLYVGEDPAEVRGAEAAGMAAILKPIPPA